MNEETAYTTLTNVVFQMKPDAFKEHKYFLIVCDQEEFENVALEHSEESTINPLFRAEISNSPPTEVMLFSPNNIKKILNGETLVVDAEPDGISASKLLEVMFTVTFLNDPKFTKRLHPSKNDSTRDNGTDDPATWTPTAGGRSFIE